MPSSGDLRLRTFILALTALGGIWIALVIQRTHHVPAAAFASGPQPADFPAPKLVRVPGLNRPVAATPIANASPRVRPFTRVPTKQTPDVQVSLAAGKTTEARPRQPAPPSSCRSTAARPRSRPLRHSSRSRSPTPRSSPSPRPARVSPGRPTCLRRRRRPSASTRRRSGRSRAATGSSSTRAS